MLFIFLADKPKLIWYKIPDKQNLLNLLSVIIKVFISSIDIKNKKYERIKVKTIEIIIITYFLLQY